ncbi:MAG: glycosyltransferase [Actinomycetota bacterium]|nr:glycosyltransferase [Actinomycetota bacterium]MDP2287476.1 glycosyltransferase [Actinomycetota bacterium]
MPALVSVVVPVYNGMPHLAALTQSLLAQTYPNLEFVFSEGGGSDGSLDFLRSLTDPRIRIIEQQGRPSAGDNWTLATQAGTGAYIKLVCQDDLLAPDAVAKQVTDLDNHPSAVMAIAQRDIVDAKGALLYPKRGCSGLPAGLHPGEHVIRTCFRQGTNVIGEPLAVLFRREAVLAAMPWSDANPLVLDLDCYQRVAPQGDVLVRLESIGSFRVSTSSWSTRLAKQQLAQFHQWQSQYAAQAHPSPNQREMRKARRSARAQTALRRAAYGWLRLKGGLKST